MTVEAPLSRYKKNNLLIMIALLVGLGIWFYYDGHHNPDFISKHTQPDGAPDSTLSFNRKAPPFIVGAGIALGIYLAAIRGRKVVADETELRSGSATIPYSTIEKINKTYFDKKGYFVLTYTDGGQHKELRLSDRWYDNLPAVLDHIVAKIS
ncbi:MAG: hypothetical protein L0Y36_03070 [Planctomycetales bacterium]|nr:hypothetical protein [Planctomycetales bacterium]